MIDRIPYLAYRIDKKLKGVVFVICDLDQNTNMMLVALDDGIFTTNIMIIFYRDKKEIPISAVVPYIREVEAVEDLTAGGYMLALTGSDGKSSIINFSDLEDIAAYFRSAFQMRHLPQVSPD